MSWELVFTLSFNDDLGYDPEYEVGKAHLSNNQSWIENLTPNISFAEVFSATTDVKNNLVYWTASEKGQTVVYRSVLSWPLPVIKQIFVNTGIYEANGISYDWITGNIYFIDSKTRQIIVCPPINATRCAVVLEDFSVPSKIALDPNRG